MRRAQASPAVRLPRRLPVVPDSPRRSGTPHPPGLCESRARSAWRCDSRMPPRRAGRRSNPRRADPDRERVLTPLSSVCMVSTTARLSARAERALFSLVRERVVHLRAAHCIVTLRRRGGAGGVGVQGEKHPGVLFPGESAAGGEGGVILYCVPGEQDVKATRFQCRLQMLCQTKILGSFVSSFSGSGTRCRTVRDRDPVRSAFFP